MYQQGIYDYIRSQVQKPVFSEVYVTPAIVTGGNLIATKTFNNQKVVLILMQSMIISMPQANAGNYIFADNYGRIIHRVTAPGTINGSIDLPYFFPGDTITITTPNTAGLNFSIVYQYIQEYSVVTIPSEA